MKKIRTQSKNGFTLVEIMVSVAIFAIIMTLGIGALINVTQAYRASGRQKTILDSLSFVMENISRDIRTGSLYYSGEGSGSSPITRDGTGTSLSFEASDNRGYFVYTVQNGVLYRSIDGGAAQALSSVNDIVLDSGTRFTVIGSGSYANGDTFQPSVWINLQGHLVEEEDEEFLLQTIVSQRKVDF